VVSCFLDGSEDASKWSQEEEEYCDERKLASTSVIEVWNNLHGLKTRRKFEEVEQDEKQTNNNKKILFEIEWR